VNSRKFALCRAQAALAALLVFQAPGCKPQAEAGAPKENSISRDVERQVASLEALWAARATANQGSLVEPTRRLIQAYPDARELEPLRLSLATFLVHQSKLGEAEALIGPLFQREESLARDEATMLLGEIRIAEGRGPEALSLLTPLGPRLVTEEARARYADAMVQGALSARSWRLAVENLIRYLSEGNHDSERASALSLRVLEQVPVEAQRRLLEDWPSGSSSAPERSSSEIVRKMVLERLVEVALTRDDARLARDLVETGPSWVRRGERGEKLTLLASLALDRTQVVSRMIGTVLGGHSASLTRRTVNATTGLSEALDARIRLATEDDRGPLADSLAALVGQGAGILVAGVDEGSVREALSFAEHHQVPVILLGPSIPGLSPRFGFFLGSSSDDEVLALQKGLSALAGPSPVVSADSAHEFVVVCNEPESLTLPAWDARARALLVMGDIGCAERVIEELRPLKKAPRLAFGLDAAPARVPGSYYLRSHQSPRPKAQGSAAQPSLTESWFSALGRDAAKLASLALEATPLPENQGAATVLQYHEALRDALAQVVATLETTTTSGFQGGNVLERAYVLERAD
jgi:hypothetical protein